MKPVTPVSLVLVSAFISSLAGGCATLPKVSEVIQRAPDRSETLQIASASGFLSVVEFNPVNPLKARRGWGLTHRDHRKLLIVDVKIIVPKMTDIPAALYAGRYYYSDLLKAGVKLYELRKSMLHAKTGVIDGAWSTVGSTNMDFWSFLNNVEVNAVILSRAFAVEMERMFARDLEESDPIRLEEWKKRPL